MKKYLFTYLFLLITINSVAQAVWQANVQTVDKSGYYNIELSQEIIGLSVSNDLSDIKIRDGKAQEIPYFLRPVNPIQEISRFDNFTLKQNSVKDSLNVIIIDNSKKESVNRFYIVVNSADVNKYASIRGSNNTEQWYIVKQKTAISDIGYTEGNSREILILDFPEGNYKYYEVILSNNQNSPLEVLNVGKISNSNIYGQFTEISIGQFTQKDSTDKKTYIYIPYIQNAYRISKLEFVVSSKADYFRKALIIDSVHNNSVNLKLSSKSDNIFYIGDFKLGRGTSIEIENYNNPPLVIDSIRAFGLNRYICAYLEEGEKYFLLTGQRDSIPPRYDIEHFRKEIPEDLTILKTDSLHCVVCPESEPLINREPFLIENPFFLWGIIILIGIFLTFICVKMIKEIKKKRTE